MSTVKYAVVAGHNAIVTGASGVNGYKEHEVTRLIAAKVLEYFAKIGETAYNCTDDIGTTQTMVWSNAVKKCNQCIGANGLAISIHMNSATPAATGTEVLHYNSPVLAQKVSDAVAAVLEIPSRGAKDGKSIGFINSTQSTAILIEVAFITNASDMDKLMKRLDAVAIAIVETATGKKIPAPAPVVKEAVPSGIVYIETGGYAGAALSQVHDYLFRTGHGFDCKRGDDGSIVFLIGRFDTSQANFKECVSFLETNGHSYKLISEEQKAEWK